MSWTLPLAAVVRRATTAPQLVVEECITALAVSAAVWAGWVLLRRVEQRW